MIIFINADYINFLISVITIIIITNLRKVNDMLDNNRALHGFLAHLHNAVFIVYLYFLKFVFRITFGIYSTY